MRRCLGLIWAFLLLPTLVQAQAIRLDIESSFGGAECEFLLGPVGWPWEATVYLSASAPVQTVRLRLEYPDCSGLSVAQPIVVNGTATGDLQTGMEITLNSCEQSQRIPILRIPYIAMEEITDTCEWTFAPHAEDEVIRFTDCEGYSGSGASSGSGLINGDCGLVGPDFMRAAYRPVPADGATDVPVLTAFEWFGSVTGIYLADHPFDIVIPGHSHWADDQIFESGSGAVQPFDPGALQPATTYYWRLTTFCYGCPHGQGAVSETWSFTTQPTVNVQEETWTNVKALFR